MGKLKTWKRIAIFLLVVILGGTLAKPNLGEELKYTVASVSTKNKTDELLKELRK